MIGLLGAVRVMLATRLVDFRKGMDGLAMLVHDQLGADPFCGTVFAFRSKRADRLKLLFLDGTGVVLVAKRLEAGASRWPRPGDAALLLTAAEMAALVHGLDWRRVHVPREIVVPRLAGYGGEKAGDGHGDCSKSFGCFSLSFAVMLAAEAVHLKALGSSLACSIYRSMAATRSSTDRNTPRLRVCRVSLEKKPSTAFSQEHEVGVKWNIQRGLSASQASTSGCL